MKISGNKKVVKFKCKIMKKLFLAMAVTGGVFVFAQEVKTTATPPVKMKEPVRFGIKLSNSEVTTGTTTVRTKQDYSTTLNYISVPVMLQMKPTDNFYVEAGPEVSYFVDGKNKGEQTIATTTAGTTTTQTLSASESINKDDIKKFNLGFGVGLGYYFTRNLGINARYVNSLTHIYNNSDAVTDAQKNVNTNRSFQLGLNYKF